MASTSALGPAQTSTAAGPNFEAPPVHGNPLLDLGRFEKSNRPSQEGLLDLGLFEISKGPSQQGLLDLGLFEISNGPSQQGLLDIGLFEISNGPSQVIAKTL